MPTFSGGSANNQGRFDATQILEATATDLAHGIFGTLDRIENKLRWYEDFMAGPVGEVADNLGPIADALALVKKSAKNLPLINAAFDIGGKIGKAHLASNALRSYIDFAGYAAEAPTPDEIGYMPLITASNSFVEQEVQASHTILQAQGSTDLSDLESMLLTLPEDVWNLEKTVNPLGTTPQYLQMWEVVMYAYDMGRYVLGTSGLVLPSVRDFALIIGDAAWLPDNYADWGDRSSISLPSPVDLDAKPGDQTLLAYLQETQPTFNWGYSGPDGGNLVGDDTIWAAAIGVYGSYWRCLHRDSTLVPVEEPPAASIPVWPGLDGVTLGDPVEFTSMIHVTAEMDGVLLSIDSIPPGHPTYNSPSGYRYYHIGWLTFQSDNGQFEEIQVLDWPSGVYVPKHMAHAAGIDIWTKPNSHGIVTPWSLNSDPPAARVASRAKRRLLT